MSTTQVDVPGAELVAGQPIPLQEQRVAAVAGSPPIHAEGGEVAP
jgi:hypothetical protein